MLDTNTHFKWFRGSPEWIQQGDDWLLAQKIGSPHSEYRPLAEHTGLYRNFVATKPTREGILAFAKQYGLLGIGGPDTVVGEAVNNIEWFGQWKREIELLQLAEKLRQAFKKRQLAEAKQFFVKQRGITFFRADGVANIPIADVPGVPADLFVLTGRAIQSLVNEQLQVATRLLWNHSFSELRLHRVPKSLLSAMWLQFARAVEGDKQFVQCEECMMEFEVESTEGNRKDKRYCGDACRARAYRNRRKEALDLNRLGRSAASIAKQLGTDVKTVKGWVK